MTEDIQALIEKINEDGIKVAQEKALQIESQAKLHALEITKTAKEDAEKIIGQARERIAKDQERNKVLLIQASRDMLLNLRKEINDMLQKVVNYQVKQSMPEEAVKNAIVEFIKNESKKHEGQVIVSVSKEDVEGLGRVIIPKLKENIKKEVILKSDEDITAGLTISFDSGKSCYDFSDKALAEYIGNYLKPKLQELLAQAVK